MMASDSVCPLTELSPLQPEAKRLKINQDASSENQVGTRFETTGANLKQMSLFWSVKKYSLH